VPSFADTRIAQSTSLRRLAPSIQRQSEQRQPATDGKDAATGLSPFPRTAERSPYGLKDAPTSQRTSVSGRPFLLDLVPSFADARIAQSTSPRRLAPSIQRQSEQRQPATDGKDAATGLYIVYRQSGNIDNRGVVRWGDLEERSEHRELHNASAYLMDDIRTSDYNHWGESDRCDFPPSALRNTPPHVLRVCRGRRLGQLPQLVRFYVLSSQ
jgi:hypothetical protein